MNETNPPIKLLTNLYILFVIGQRKIRRRQLKCYLSKFLHLNRINSTLWNKYWTATKANPCWKQYFLIGLFYLKILYKFINARRNDLMYNPHESLQCQIAVTSTTICQICNSWTIFITVARITTGKQRLTVFSDLQSDWCSNDLNGSKSTTGLQTIGKLIIR